MKGIVDRIEEGIVLVELESGDMAEFELCGQDVSEGDVVEIEGNMLVVDIESTESRKRQIEELFNSLIE